MSFFLDFSGGIEMNINKLVRFSLLIALSGVGGFIKIPSPTGTVAFDSLPGYFAACLLPGGQGALIAGIGHLFSAMTASFYLGGLHLIVALEMALSAALFGYFYKKKEKSQSFVLVAIVVGVLFNGIIEPLSFVPFLGLKACIALIPSLVVGSIANILLASLLASLNIWKKGNVFNERI